MSLPSNSNYFTPYCIDASFNKRTLSEVNLLALDLSELIAYKGVARGGVLRTASPKAGGSKGGPRLMFPFRRIVIFSLILLRFSVFSCEIGPKSRWWRLRRAILGENFHNSLKLVH